MIDRNAWNCYIRRTRDEPWVWVGSGFTYGEAASAAVLKAPDAERVVLFGKALPGRDGEPVPITRRRF